MTDRQILALNFIVFLFLAFVLSAMQSSMLSQVFGSQGTPVLWLSLTVYFSLKRDYKEVLIWIYALTLINLSFSYSPLAFFLFSQLLVLGAVKFLRERIFWSGGTYFMLVYGVAVCIYHLSYFFLSRLIEDNPMGTPFWLNWFLQLLWVPVVSVPLFYFYELIDHWTKRPSQSSSLEAL